MSEPSATSRREDWLEFWDQRELSFFKALPYPLLALCVVFDIGLRHGLGSATRVDLAVAAGAALTMVVADRLDHRLSWLEDEGRIPAAGAVVLLIALITLAVILVIRQPIYGFFGWTGYIWAWRLLAGNWRFLGVAATALVVATSQTGGGPYKSTSAVIGLIAVYMINVVVATGFTWFGWIGNEQQQRHAAHVITLREANTKLEETLRDNAALHEQLLAQARATGVAEERQRMAREIHDTLAQGLTGIITQLQAAQSAGAGKQAGAGHIDSAVQLARESLTEARRSLRALAPEALDGARLPEAVADVARRWSALQGLALEFTTTGTVRAMRPEVEVALLRTAQEALANVAKHARASRVGLTLSYMEDLVTLDVRDDGVGFTTVNGSGPRRPLQAHGGFGLDAMRQRVEGVGGRLAIESEPGGGTAVSAAVPALAAGCQ